MTPPPADGVPMISPLASLARGRSLVRCAASVFAIAFALGCGGGGGDSTGPGGNPTPGFTITASANAITVARGASGTVTVTVARTGGFSGPVSLQPTGMPSGVTALFSAPSVAPTATTSTLTIAAASTATAGTATITVIGNGANVANQSLTIQLTITAPAASAPFDLALSVSSFLALPPTNLTQMPILTITRNAGFTGPVTIAVTGQPPGLVAAVTPTNVTGTTASLGVIDGGAAKGTYPITIHGTGGGGEQTLTFNVVVAAPSTGATTWTFCGNAARAPQYFFAVKDGAGAWTRVVPNGDSYSFTIASPSAQVAMVVPEGGGFRTTVYQYTATEIAAKAASECANYPGTSTRTVTGQVTGLATTDLSFTTMGAQHAGTLGPGPYTLMNLPPGAQDLVSVRGALNQQADFIANRIVVRRGVNPASGATNPTIDFGAAEAFAPTTATWTFNNTNNEAFSISEMFRTAGNSPAVLLPFPAIDRTTTTRTVYAVPAGQTVAGDLHQVIATVLTTDATSRVTRQIVAYNRTLADRTVSFGPAMPAATVTVVSGAPPGRIRAQGTLPNEYNSGVSLDVTQTTGPRYATIHATRGFLGSGSAYDMQLPDLSGVVGWDSNFALRSGVAATYWVSGGGPALDTYDARYLFNATRVRFAGAQTGITAPADGSTYVIGRVAGNVTP